MDTIRLVRQYAWAFLLALLVWIRLRKDTVISLSSSVEWSVIATQAKNLVPKREMDRWFAEEIEKITQQMGFGIPQGAYRAYRQSGHMVLKANKSDRNIRTRMRMEVAAMRITRGLHERHRVYVMEQSDLSRCDLAFMVYLYRVLAFLALVVHTITFGSISMRITPQAFAFVGKAAGNVSLKKGTSSRYQRAMGYFATFNTCCLQEGNNEEMKQRLDIMGKVLPAFGRNTMAVHALHCMAVRMKWHTSNNHIQGTWKDVTARIGNPFEKLGMHYTPLLKLPRTFTKEIYTFENLLVLAEFIIEKEVDRKFIHEVVTRFYMFLPPEQYPFLLRVSRDPVFSECGFAGLAWLYHSYVPLEDVVLCSSLLPYAGGLRQARELAAKGVLPELLEELHSAALLPLLTGEILSVHQRCQEYGMEKVITFLKAGGPPDRLQAPLLLGQEFPGKSADEIVQIVFQSNTLEIARTRLAGKELVNQISVGRELQQSISTKRKRRQNELVSAVEKEAIFVAEVATQNNIKRISPHIIERDMPTRRLIRGLKRVGFDHPRKGDHQVYVNGTRRITIPASHTITNRYTLAEAFTQARFTEEEVMQVMQ